MHLVRTVENPGRPRAAVHPLQRQIGRVAEPTVYLDRPIDDVV